MLNSIYGRAAVILFSALVVALFANPTMSGEPVRIFWLVDTEQERTAGERLMRFMTIKTGVKTDLTFLESPARNQKELYIAIDRARGADGDLIFGLSRQQAQMFQHRGLSAIKADQLGLNSFRSLQISGSRRVKGTSDASVLGVPIKLSLPIICAGPGAELAEFGRAVTISQIAYRRMWVSVADPRRDPVGLSVLLSTFLEGKGPHGGWEIFGSLDRLVDGYPANRRESCERVANGRADLGFALLGDERDIKRKWPEIGFLALDRAMLAPVGFASAVDRRKDGTSDDALKVLRWLSDEGVRLAAREVADAARRRGYRVSTDEMLDHAIRLRYFSVSEIVDIWSTRYGFKTYRSIDDGKWE